ncbi:hypothetical protein NKH09_15895 [Mesorhizobium sp. M1339]|uniref:hypothetical protein n=1 Tax=Mesorhizobium sp. M1339 TaxID=2957086 RepID=UPI0033360B04
MTQPVCVTATTFMAIMLLFVSSGSSAELLSDRLDGILNTATDEELTALPRLDADVFSLGKPPFTGVPFVCSAPREVFERLIKLPWAVSVQYKLDRTNGYARPVAPNVESMLISKADREWVHNQLTMQGAYIDSRSRLKKGASMASQIGVGLIGIATNSKWVKGIVLIWTVATRGINTSEKADGELIAHLEAATKGMSPDTKIYRSLVRVTGGADHLPFLRTVFLMVNPNQTDIVLQSCYIVFTDIPRLF